MLSFDSEEFYIFGLQIFSSSMYFLSGIFKSNNDIFKSNKKILPNPGS